MGNRDKIAEQIMKELAKSTLSLIGEIQEVTQMNERLRKENIRLRKRVDIEQAEQLRADIWKWKKRIRDLEMKAEQLLIQIEKWDALSGDSP